MYDADEPNTISAADGTEYQTAEDSSPTLSDTVCGNGGKDAGRSPSGGKQDSDICGMAGGLTHGSADEREGGGAAGEGGLTPAAGGGDETSGAPFMTVRYNHRSRALTKDEAVTLAQKGLYYDEKLAPVYAKLDYLAAQYGMTADAFAESLISSSEDKLRAELSERYDDPEAVERMVELSRRERQEKYERLTAVRRASEKAAQNIRRESLERRLAREYRELKNEFPETESFAALPKGVKELAAGGMDLLSAYLRYRHSEEKRIAAYQRNSERARDASAGTAASYESEAPSDRAFIRGLWS